MDKYNIEILKIFCANLDMKKVMSKEEETERMGTCMAMVMMTDIAMGNQKTTRKRAKRISDI